MGPSKWRPNHIVPTYFVSSKPRKGCFVNINDAIGYAQPYSRIELLPGKYSENVFLNKALEISTEQGQEMAEITASSTGYAFTFATPEAFVEAVCIKSQENALRAALRVESGHPTIVRCEITGIEVSGDATPLVDECRIIGGSVNGIYVLNQAGGTYRSNKIEKQGWFSIHVESSGGPLFLHNRIRSGMQGQVMVDGSVNHSNPQFQYNRITDENEEDDTEKHTVYTRAFKLEKLKVKLPGQVVNLMPQVTASLIGAMPDEDDMLQRKALSEVRSAIVIVGREAMPIFQRNNVVGCSNNAFRIAEGSKGIYENNYVSSNDGWAFVVENIHTEPVISGNSITCNGAGIKVIGSKARIIGKNEILDNRYTQLYVEHAHPDFKFIGNEVRSSTGIGVHCVGAGQGLIEQNIMDQCNIGIRIEDSANPTVRLNQISACCVGALVHKEGLGKFEENELDHCSKVCVQIATFGNPTLRKCRMVQSHCGVVISRRGRGIFENCVIKDNKSAQIEVYDYGEPRITNCAILDGREEGIAFHHNGRGVVQHCMIGGNDRANIVIRTRADPIIDSNVLTKAHEDGLVVEDFGMGTITNNIIERCKQSGITVMNGANPMIRANHVSLCRQVGLHVLEGGLGVYEKNTFVRNIKANVCIAGQGVLANKRTEKKKNKKRHGEAAESHHHDGAKGSPRGDCGEESPVLLRNVMAGSHGEGIIISNYAVVSLRKNVFSGNNGASVKASSASIVTVCECIFDLGQDGVVAHDDGTQVVIVNNCFFHQMGTSIAADLCAKVLACYNTFDQCAHGLRMGSSLGHVYENSFLRCGVGASLGNMCRIHIGFNAFTECAVGVHVGARCRAFVWGNTMQGCTESGALIDGEDSAGCSFDGNVISSCHQGIAVAKHTNAKLSTNLIVNCVTGVTISGAQCSPTISAMYISCCPRGVLAMNSCKGRLEGSLIGHCDIGVEICEMSNINVRQCLIYSSAAIGVNSLGPCDGEMFECTLFKNFINFAASEEGAATSALRCVLQAPTVASCFFTNASKPSLTKSAIVSRSLGRDVEFEDGGDLDAGPKRIRAQLVKKIGSSRADSVSISDLRMPGLWDDLFAEDAGCCISDGQPGSIIDATSSAQKMPFCSRPAGPMDDGTGSVTSAKRGEKVALIGQPGEMQEREFPAQSVLENPFDESEDFQEASAVSAAPSDPDREESSLSSTRRKSPLLSQADASPPVPAAGSSRAGGNNRLKKRRRLTAILYPTNINNMELEAAGPGGPFAMNRVIGADVSVGMRGLYTYLSTGVIIAEEANPSLDGCIFRDHSWKEAWVAMRSRESLEEAMAAAAAAEAARPPTPEKVDFSVNPRRKAPAPPTGKKEGRKNSVISRNDSVTRDPKTIFMVDRGLFPCDTKILLYQILLTASPAFYQRRGAPLPELVAGSMYPAALQSSSSAAAPGDALVPSRSGVGSGAFAAAAGPPVLTTASTRHLLGCGVLVLDKGKGVVNCCVFQRNTVAVRVMGGGNPVVKHSVLSTSVTAGLEVCAGGLGMIRHCRILQNKTTQVSVSGLTSKPTISDTDISEGFVGLTFELDCTADVSNCVVRDIGNIGVVVESNANPTLSSSRIAECQVGIEARKEARGTFKSCIVNGCKKEGCAVDGKGTAPLFQNCMFSENGVGLRAANGGVAAATDSEFFENTEDGLEVHSDGMAKIHSCKSYDNSGHGLLFRDLGRGDVISCHVCTNRRANISVSSGAAPRIAHSFVFDGDSDGICIEDASPVIDLTRIYSNSGSGISLTGKLSKPEVSMCEIDNCERYGIHASYGAGGIFRQMVVTNSRSGGVVIESQATCPLLDNMFLKANRCFTVWARDGAKGELRRSILLSTIPAEGGENRPQSPSQSPQQKPLEAPPAGAGGDDAGPIALSLSIAQAPSVSCDLVTTPGILIESGANPCISQCVILLQPGIGISVVNRGIGEISDCVIGSCRKSCITVSGAQSLPKLRGVTCFDAEAGVTFLSNAGGLLSSCLLLGGFRRRAISVAAACGPSIEQCLIMQAAVGVSDTGRARFSGCYFYMCSTAMELNGESEVEDCEIKDCTVGILSSAATSNPKIRSTVIIQCSRAGLMVSPHGGSPTVVKCNFNRNRYGVLLEGGSGGLIENCDLFNNYDCILVNNCNTISIKNNNVYDAQHEGITVKGGNPTVYGNFVYDCNYAGIHLEAGEGEVEENRACFPKEDGGLVQDPTSKANVGRNNIKNSWSPPQEPSAQQRSSLYKRQEQEREKPTQALRRVAKLVDSGHHEFVNVVPQLSFAASQLCLNPVWLLEDKMATEHFPSEAAVHARVGATFTGSIRNDDRILSAQPSGAVTAGSPLSSAGSATFSSTSSKVFTAQVREMVALAVGADKKHGASPYALYRGPGNESYARRVLDIPLLMGDVHEAVQAALVGPPAAHHSKSGTFAAVAVGALATRVVAGVAAARPSAGEPAANSTDPADAALPLALSTMRDRLAALLDQGYKALLTGGQPPQAAPQTGAPIAPTKPDGKDAKDGPRRSSVKAADLKKIKSIKK
jgi:parallel beta-helix repeat protein